MTVSELAKSARLLWYGGMAAGALLGLAVAVVAVDTYIAHSRPHAPKGQPHEPAH